jgi:hypothetical protein
MTTHNHLANSQYIAAYQAEISSGLRDARRSNGVLRTLRDHAEHHLRRSRAWLGATNGLEADTRQIRSFDRSWASGACEVYQGARLATG